MDRVGVVGIPMLFGDSWSFRRHMRRLRRQGCRTMAVDPYHGGRRPFFLPLVAGPTATPERRNALAAALDQKLMTAQIEQAVAALRASGCRLVVLVGFGYGAVAALLNAHLADAVIGWYPHLVALAGWTAPVPDVAGVGCPVLLFFGTQDQETPESLARGRQAADEARGGLTVVVVEGAGHAFADFTAQGFWPSIRYRRRAARWSWAVACDWLGRLAT